MVETHALIHGGDSLPVYHISFVLYSIVAWPLLQKLLVSLVFVAVDDVAHPPVTVFEVVVLAAAESVDGIHRIPPCC